MRPYLIAATGGAIAFTTYLITKWFELAAWWGSIFLLVIAVTLLTINGRRRRARAFAAIIPALTKLGEANFTQICRQVKADTGIDIGAEGYVEMHRLERKGVVEMKMSDLGVKPRRMIWRVTPRAGTTTVRFGDRVREL